MIHFRLFGDGSVVWYRTLHFKIFMTITLVFCAFCACFSWLTFRNWENYWIDQRMSEVSRYGNYVAGEITSYDRQNGTSGTFLNADLQTINRLYSYMRILVLDENGCVVQDSSSSRNGRYIINDEVLSALSGTIAYGGDEQVRRMAIPIANSEDVSKVKGVVYVFVSLESLRQSLNNGKEQILLTEFALGVLALFAFYFISEWACRPLSRLIRWLKQFRNGNAEEIRPSFKHDEEYQLVVGAVEEATHDLISMDQSRKEFVSNVSHELKTPLSSIKVLTESLLLQQSVSEELYKDFLQDINSEIDRMSNIVNDLLTLVRLEEGENALNLTVFNLGDMVEDILKRLKPLADQRNITLSLETNAEVEIEADSTKLTLAISNLVQNGIKYNRDDGKVTVRIDKSEPCAVISVSDTGIGIDEEHFDRLFQRFYRVDKSRDRAAGGSGLGLSIVRQIITMHKGTISVSSVSGKGSTFMVKIPLEQTIDSEEEEA